MLALAALFLFLALVVVCIGLLLWVIADALKRYYKTKGDKK